MGKRDPRIDAYIAKSPDFAQPILKQLREAVHAGCPDVVETLKWRMPSFEYKGILCGMAAFKKHCVFGFWKHKLVVGDDSKANDAMGSFGCITKRSELPPKAKLVSLVKKAAKLNDEGIKAVRDKTRRKKPIAMPPALKAALAKNKKALATFKSLSPSHQREYMEWIADAKQDATRDRRLATAIEWLAQGKTRNWKYETR